MILPVLSSLLSGRASCRAKSWRFNKRAQRSDEREEVTRRDRLSRAGRPVQETEGRWGGEGQQRRGSEGHSTGPGNISEHVQCVAEAASLLGSFPEAAGAGLGPKGPMPQDHPTRLPRTVLSPSQGSSQPRTPSSMECFRDTPRERRGKGTPWLPLPALCGLTGLKAGYWDGGCANAQMLSPSHRSGFVPASNTHCQAGNGCQGPGSSPWVTGREGRRWWLCHWPERGDSVLNAQLAAMVTGQGCRD